MPDAQAGAKPVFGGQALIEGVMIRGPRTASVAVRLPDGNIHSEFETVSSPLSELHGVPLVRGLVALGETFVVGVKALYRSMKLSGGRTQAGPSPMEVALSVITITVAALLFFVGPVLMTSWLDDSWGHERVEVLAEGLLRLAMLGGYIWSIGRLPEVRRVFAYHAAEHRAVHAYEHGVELSREGLRSFPNAHPRCGTAFLLTVALVSLAVCMFLGTPSLTTRILERLILMPVVAAFAYEVLRLNRASEPNAMLRLLSKPNIWLQAWTTADPDDEQLDVSIAEMRCSIAAEAAVTDVIPVTPTALEAVPATTDDAIDM
jgi:uncharacterized protein YqhQ